MWCIVHSILCCKCGTGYTQGGTCPLHVNTLGRVVVCCVSLSQRSLKQLQTLGLNLAPKSDKRTLLHASPMSAVFVGDPTEYCPYRLCVCLGPHRQMSNPVFRCVLRFITSEGMFTALCKRE